MPTIADCCLANEDPAVRDRSKLCDGLEHRAIPVAIFVTSRLQVEDPPYEC